MPTINPRTASLLAESVYDIFRPTTSGQYIFNPSPDLAKYFEFDLSDGPVKASSGSFWRFSRETTGFALVGKGKGKYNNDHVIAVRGTKSTHDWLTNSNIGLAVSHNRSQVHAGFQQTFSSMRPLLEQQLSPRLRQTPGNGLVHCVGHSLGGALASLIAEWVRTRYRRAVNLYTFGAPRVGLQGFADKSTGGVERIYRCTHGADPVPKVPLWPFTHAPTNGAREYRLDGGHGMSVSAHSMSVDAVPGYRNTANSGEWGALKTLSTDYLSQPVRLRYEHRHQASFTAWWADRINAALVTLLKDAGYYNAVLAQAAISSSLTFYDLLARTLHKVADASQHFAEQTRGLIGHMLVFAGKHTVEAVKLTYRFIRWVFDQTLKALYRSVKQALDSV